MYYENSKIVTYPAEKMFIYSPEHKIEKIFSQKQLDASYQKYPITLVMHRI